jgi:ABC-type bacteriocin/lantibiotic exporter with double-glycine peptidase domain
MQAPRAAAALAALALAGCITVYPGTARPARLEDLRQEPGWILLDRVPHVAQESPLGCGAACLAMVLAHGGVPVAPAELEKECAAPGREGLRAADLRDAARRRGRQAFVVAGREEDLEHELTRGRPVVVGLLKPAGEAFTTHFAVVIGLHPARGRVAARDPALGLVTDSLEGFEREWGPTGRVTLVVLPPEEPRETVAEHAENEGGGS